MNNENEQTGIKQLIQSMVPEQLGIVEGKVLSTNPLEVVLVNDDKMRLSSNTLVIPQHLTNYIVSVSSTTSNVEGHKHNISSLTINGALKSGETVYLLSFNGGKQYFVLDRKGG